MDAQNTLSRQVASSNPAIKNAMESTLVYRLGTLVFSLGLILFAPKHLQRKKKKKGRKGKRGKKKKKKKKGKEKEKEKRFERAILSPVRVTDKTLVILLECSAA